MQMGAYCQVQLGWDLRNVQGTTGSKRIHTELWYRPL